MSGRILIVGHGAAGRTLARDIRKRGGVVVGFLDDLPQSGRVLGTLADVNNVIESHAIDLVYFAIPTVKAAIVRDFINSIEQKSVDIAIIPRTYEILAKETVDINDLTDVDILDLVGREPVKHNFLASREFIAGKRILVTGAAGSIGSRLVKHIVDMNPSLVVCVDWWENGIFYLGQELGSRENVVLRIGDIKSRQLMDQVFSEHRPEIVFHAAAFKHVPLMQDNPLEAVNNNVWGSLNLMRLAISHDVEHFVYVSTDKAVNPANVMGSTKRLGEMVMESLSGQRSTKFNAVRFGNVIESNGSVMQTFRNQIVRRVPLTVTHPDITRFFMTVDEASQLIIQSALLGHESEIFVLDMGEPVKILDLAKSLVRAVDPSMEITITGLRPGEKMYEELTYEPDKVGRTANGKIFIVRNERVFDTSAFMKSIEALLERTRNYQITSSELVAFMRDMGFQIQ